MTDTGFKSFDCTLVSTLETFDDHENGNYSYYTYCNICTMAIMHIMIVAIFSIIFDCFLVGWLESVGSHVVYELDYNQTFPVRRSHSEYHGQASLGARR
jgi:hypothetical protein